MARELTAGTIRTARIIAIVADLIQLTPALWGGAMNPMEDGLDIVVAFLLSYLLGFHWAFLPSFLMELVPVVDFAPTWTIAVLIVTRKGSIGPEAPVRVWPVSSGKSSSVIDVEIQK